MHRVAAGLACLVLVAACGKSSAPVAPGHDDGGEASKLACLGQRDHVAAIYQAAADAEAVSLHLRAEFVEALVHMAMADCAKSPRQVSTCLGKSTSARDIETQCLLPIDDAGETEGRRFAGSAR